MTDTDVIEAINFEQLATMTDRLLLRHGRGQHRLLPPVAPSPVEDRFSVPSLVGRKAARWPAPRIESTVPGYRVTGPRTLARGSQARLRPAAATPTHARLHWLAVTVVIPALLGTVAGLLLLL
ncbi:MAG TPA: hypothetical protein VFP84_31085 [Kofleriaceae bacterium]|nr:hypothetical protein [Kofleriaceae bacterium]